MSKSVTITENGKRKKISKLEAATIQLACGSEGRGRRCVAEGRHHHTEDGAMTNKKAITGPNRQ
jgi:hypothetical protein